MEQQQWDWMLRYVCLEDDKDRLQILGSMIDLGIDNEEVGREMNMFPAREWSWMKVTFSFIGAIDAIDQLTILR